MLTFCPRSPTQVAGSTGFRDMLCVTGVELKMRFYIGLSGCLSVPFLLLVVKVLTEDSKKFSNARILERR